MAAPRATRKGDDTQRVLAMFKPPHDLCMSTMKFLANFVGTLRRARRDLHAHAGARTVPIVVRAIFFPKHAPKDAMHMLLASAHRTHPRAIVRVSLRDTSRAAKVKIFTSDIKAETLVKQWRRALPPAWYHHATVLHDIAAIVMASADADIGRRQLPLFTGGNTNAATKAKPVDIKALDMMLWACQQTRAACQQLRKVPGTKRGDLTIRSFHVLEDERGTTVMFAVVGRAHTLVPCATVLVPVDQDTYMEELKVYGYKTPLPQTILDAKVPANMVFTARFVDAILRGCLA